MSRATGMRVIRWMAAVIMAVLSVSAGASDHIVERAWFEDPTGSMRLDEVRGQPLQRFEGNLVRGFGDSPLWVRLRIDPKRTQEGTAVLVPDRLILSVYSMMMIRAVIYDPQSPESQVTGAPAADRMVERSGSPSLEFTVPRGDAPRDVWLRLQSHHSRNIAFSALPPDEAIVRDQQRKLITAVYFGVLLLTIAWALLTYAFQRDRIVLFFLVQQLAFVAYALTLLGYGALFLPGSASPATSHLIGDVVQLGYTAIGLGFCRALLVEYRPPRWGMRLLLGCILLLPLELALLFSGRPMLALHVTNLVGLFGALLLVVLALTSRRKSDADGPAIGAGPLAAILGVILVAVGLGTVGWLGPHALAELNRYALLAVGLVLGLLLMIFLEIRTRRIAARHGQALLELEIERRTSANERAAREDREKLLAMLAHEIKTPLSTLRVSISGQRHLPAAVGRAITDIDGVIERCVQLGMLEGARIEPDWTQCELGEVLAQVPIPEPQEGRIDWSAAESCSLTTDRQILGIILRNLLDNACRYSPMQSTVHVGSHAAARDGRPGVEVSVANEPGASGWPDPAQLFSKYYRAPQARRGIGSGLGLYLSAGLAMTLGGSVDYRPTDTHVRFTLWLPLLQAGGGS